MLSITRLTIFLIGVVSAYALLQSARSIPRLQRYEKKAEKAAEWSKTAEKRLWDTRYTVGAGFIAATLSVLAALSFLLFVPTGASISSALWCSLLAAGQAGTARYMRAFWRDKAKLPLMEEYNLAIGETGDVIAVLDRVALGWAGVGALRVVGL